MAEPTKITVSALQYLKGVGPKRAEALAAEGIITSGDLLRFFPRAYIDRNALPSIRALKTALQQEKQSDIFTSPVSQMPSEVTVVAYIRDVRDRPIANGRTMVVVVLDDNSGVNAEIIFWNQAQYFKKVYEKDQLVVVSGRAEVDDRFGKVQFHHPEIEKIDPEDEEFYRLGRILPKYRSTQKMKDAGLSMRIMRNLIASVIDLELPRVPETLPEEILEKFNFPNIYDSIRQLHFPDSTAELDRTRKRMKFEELFFFELLLAMRQRGMKTEDKAIPFNPKSDNARKLLDALPFDLTKAQKRVIREILSDVEQASPMNRLLQGDVGSGKTIVALFAMLVAVDNGCQCALMAPTEILAEQHFLNISYYLKDTGISVVQLMGGQKTKARRELSEKISSGKANIIIGTHALFQSAVEYNKLGLVIIDEQHRFGVLQRAELKKKATNSFASVPNFEQKEITPHILVMSATPIPRTLAMTVYGDLDVSIIDELPKNRKPIRTKVVFESQLSTVFQFIRDEVKKGHQAYIVYPLVEKSDKIELKSAVEHHEYLQAEVFPDLKLGLLHGQMFWYEKEDAMKALKNKEFDILVATTVIEVGIDVPNATVMLIENAERFGLSQLHQLRGRVGRGADQAFCLLATKDHFRFQLSRRELEAGEQKSSIIRLKTMQETTDGFKIAEVDLELRGPGDVLGTKQSGLPDFVFTDLVTDGEIITLARKEAFALVEHDPHLREPKIQPIKQEFLRQYRQDYGFLDVA